MSVSPESATSSPDSPTTGKHIYLIDGSGFIFRAYHALPPLTRSDGTPVGAVLGFCNIILKLLDNYDIDNMAVVFDSARKTFRHDIYDLYKANRGETPEDLIPQFPLFREACTAFDLAQIELPGYEADDIIATYTKRAVEQGNEVTIVSSDKDLMQLVGPGVRMLDPIKNKFIGPDEVTEKFGVSPERVIDVQSLAGDSTDNVPGVPGIGVKTAALLINEYGDLDTLLERAGEIKQNKRRENLLEFAEDARISRQLVTLAKDVPIELRLADLALKNPNAEDLHKFLIHQGFTNLIGRLIRRGMIHPLEHGEVPEPNHTKEQGDTAGMPSHLNQIVAQLTKVDKKYELVTTLDHLKHVLDECEHVGVFAFDTETTDLNPSRADLVGFSLSCKPGQAYYVPLQHHTDQAQIPLQDALSVLKPVLQNPSHRVVGQNIKYDMRILLNYGVEIACYDDTMVMSYCAHGSKRSHALDELALQYFGHDMVKYKDVIDIVKKEQDLKTATFANVPLDQATAYAAEDADFTLRLYGVMSQELIDHKCQNLYHQLDLPMVKVLALMEHKGITVCSEKLQTLSQDFETHIQALSQEIYSLSGREFNIGSPKQMGEVLFGDMGLEGGKKSKTGAYSTGADVLDKLAMDGHVIAEKILSWRHYSKLKSTYTEALQSEISERSGRVHTSYGLTTTATGRLSSSDPNLQNIPIRTEDGRKIRQAFVPEKGYKLLALDYSQIELRLLAHAAKLDSLKTAFQNGQDIHALTASEIFDIPLEKIDPMTRRSAKAINFGIIYGISAFGLARQLNISRGEAKSHIERYFEKYPGIRRFMESQKEFAREHGYVETLLGRKCMITGMMDTNPMRRAFAERQAINAPLQGSSADIIRKAMISMGDILGLHNDPKAIMSAPSALDDRKELSNELSQQQETVIAAKPQMDLFGGDMPAGITVGMPKPKVKPTKQTATQSADLSACALVGPYGVNQPLLTGDAVRLLLQVHDELLFEVREDIVNDLAGKLKTHMESVVSLDVPLVVDAGVGQSWDEAH